MLFLDLYAGSYQFCKFIVALESVDTASKYNKSIIPGYIKILNPLYFTYPFQCPDGILIKLAWESFVYNTAVFDHFIYVRTLE